MAIKVLVVGDKPSSKNTSKYVPFIGTKSYTRLKEWLQKLDPAQKYHFHITNSYRQSELDYIESWEGPIIVLGKLAENRVKKMDKDFLKLPHPSGLNRLNNCKDYINQELEKVKNVLETLNKK